MEGLLNQVFLTSSCTVKLKENWLLLIPTSKGWTDYWTNLERASLNTGLPRESADLKLTLNDAQIEETTPTPGRERKWYEK